MNGRNDVLNLIEKEIFRAADRLEKKGANPNKFTIRAGLEAYHELLKAKEFYAAPEPNGQRTIFGLNLEKAPDIDKYLIQIVTGKTFNQHTGKYEICGVDIYRFAPEPIELP